MAYNDDPSQTTKANTGNPNKKLSSLNSNIFTMLAAFCGVVFGVLGSLGFVTSYIHSELASQTASLSHVISARNADVVTSDQCVVPSGAAGSGGGVQTAAAPASFTPGQGSGGGGQGGGGNTFVHKLVNGVFTASGTISNTGQGSTNEVNTTQTANMTVTNNNNLSFTNNNPQTATSGTSTANNNTTAGGNGSGDSSNTSNTNVTYIVNN